jgi:AmmeMemoRadiSam system protein B
LFYPDDEAALRAAVLAFVHEHEADAAARAPKALIVPHAGYLYSGTVAGCGYRLLEGVGAGIRHVVLFGPSHRVPMRGMAVPRTTYRDPLRTCRSTRPTSQAASLASSASRCAARDGAFALEVQLPFLQAVLGTFDVLPIAIGLAPPEQVARALDACGTGRIR